MVNIYLCDDNKILLERYKKKLASLAEKYQYQVSISAFQSGEQLLFHLSDNPNEADIIYLDILMGNINGIDTAKKLREIGCLSEIIFLTSSEEFVFESFDASPLYYIVKGSATEANKMEQVFVKAMNLVMEKESEVFLCESGSLKKKIPLCKISFFEIKGRVVTVHFHEGNFDFYAGIDAIESKVNDKKFVRCHRSFVVNLRYIDAIHKNDLLLTTGEVIPLGATYAKGVKLAFSSSLSGVF